MLTRKERVLLQTLIDENIVSLDSMIEFVEIKNIKVKNNTKTTKVVGKSTPREVDPCGFRVPTHGRC